MPLVAPSLLAADFLHLEKECILVNESEADWFHLDVMDGNFVPNISYGQPVIEAIHKVARKPLDVHLMVEKPERYAADFAKCGAHYLTVHYEACTHLHRNVEQIKSLGMKAGVALNPHTPVHLLHDIIHDLDLVLIMSVNPGFGGQQFIARTLDKVHTLRKMIDTAGLNTLIEVDGGVNTENASLLVQAGAHVLVAGSTVFRAADPKATITALKEAR